MGDAVRLSSWFRVFSVRRISYCDLSIGQKQFYRHRFLPHIHRALFLLHPLQNQIHSTRDHFLNKYTRDNRVNSNEISHQVRISFRYIHRILLPFHTLQRFECSSNSSIDRLVHLLDTCAFNSPRRQWPHPGET